MIDAISPNFCFCVATTVQFPADLHGLGSIPIDVTHRGHGAIHSQAEGRSCITSSTTVVKVRLVVLHIFSFPPEGQVIILVDYQRKKVARRKMGSSLTRRADRQDLDYRYMQFRRLAVAKRNFLRKQRFYLFQLPVPDELLRGVVTSLSHSYAITVDNERGRLIKWIRDTSISL
jgi:hypothetical protein